MYNVFYSYYVCRLSLNTHTGEHSVKISAYCDKNCRIRSVLKNCGLTDRQTEWQTHTHTHTDTSTNNKGR